MCMFCAAIPVTAAVAAKLNVDQQSKIHEAEESGTDIRKKPIKAVSVGVIALLAVGSVIYHTHFNCIFSKISGFPNRGKLSKLLPSC